MKAIEFINAAATIIVASKGAKVSATSLGQMACDLAGEMADYYEKNHAPDDALVEETEADQGNQHAKPFLIIDGDRKGVAIPIINKKFYFDEIKPDMKWDEAMEYCKGIGKAMPTLRECYIWQYYKEELEALFKDVGCEYPSALWSSSQCSSYYAWRLGYNGLTSLSYKCYGFSVVPLTDL